MAGATTLLKLYRQLITDNFIDVTVESGLTYRELVERVTSGAYTRIPIEFLSPTLDQRTVDNAGWALKVSESPRNFFDSLSSTSCYVWRCSPYLSWCITENGLRVAEDPPQGVSYVDANGVLMSRKHRPVSTQPQLYRSEWRRALQQGVIQCGSNAGYKEIADWISEHRAGATLASYFKNSKGERDLGWLVRHDRHIRARFQADLSKIKRARLD